MFSTSSYLREPNRIQVLKQCQLAIFLAILTFGSLQFGLSMAAGHSFATGGLLAFSTACLVGLIMARILRQPPGFPILHYTGANAIARTSGNPKPRSLHPDTLERDLRLARRMGMQIVDSRTLLQTRLAGGAVPRNALALHLDAEACETLADVTPVLERHGARGTIFVAARETFQTSRRARRSDAGASGHDALPPQWGDLRRLAAQGIVEIELKWTGGPCTVARHRSRGGQGWLASGVRAERAEEHRMRDTLNAAQTLFQRELGRPASMLCWSGHPPCLRARSLAEQAGFLGSTGGLGRNQIGADPSVVSSLVLGEAYAGFRSPWIDDLAVRAEIRCFQGYVGWSLLLAGLTVVRSVARQIGKTGRVRLSQGAGIGRGIRT